MILASREQPPLMVLNTVHGGGGYGYPPTVDQIYPDGWVSPGEEIDFSLIAEIIIPSSVKHGSLLDVFNPIEDIIADFDQIEGIDVVIYEEEVGPNKGQCIKITLRDDI